jgi:hypothetical protein
MRQVVFRAAAGGVVLMSLIASLSCGQDRKLVSITVTPNAFTFNNAVTGETVQYTAMGQFVHPPETRDITTQVVWSTPTDVVAFNPSDPPGLATVGTACGTNIPVNATASSNLHLPPTGNIVVGTATVNVKFVGCP